MLKTLTTIERDLKRWGLDKPRRVKAAGRWKPQPKQAEVLQVAGVDGAYTSPAGIIRPAAAKLVGYGGAAGGGKSDALLGIALGLAQLAPGITIGFFRRKYVELEGARGAVSRSRELFSGLGIYNQALHVWRLNNGTRLHFCHANNPGDVFNYQSQQFDVLLFDEATHFTWDMVDYLLTRLRLTTDKLPRAFAVFATNPGNVGHAWYKALFVDSQQPGQVVRAKLPGDGTGWEDVVFIPARLADNQILEQRDPEYRALLEARDADTRRALLDGDWDVFAGQAFRDWRRDRHVVDPFEIPTHWPKWRAVDWGYRNPFCCLWLARDPDSGRVIVYRELYRTDLTDRQQARLIRELTPPDEAVALTYADPSMWAKKTYEYTVLSTADEYAAEGVILSRADNDRVSGKRKLDRLLQDLPDGRPGLAVFPNCANLIRTIPGLVYDQRQVEDVDSEGEDHAYDGLRYGLTNVRMAPAPKTNSKDTQYKSPIARAFGGRRKL